MKDHIEKYLSEYAEEEVNKVKGINENYDYVIVIPICYESYDCINAIFSKIDKSLSVLVILVVNSSRNLKHKKYFDTNNRFINRLVAESTSCNTISKNCKLLKNKNKFDTVLVDRNSVGQQIDKKQGVGLARKIGCDIALKFYQIGNINLPWIYSTDADVILPRHYFSQVDQFNHDYSAIVLDFEHVCENESMKKMQYLYDLKLRYYHAGIVYAGSQYDYIPLGSTLIANMYYYAQVRGFPKKNAGEDFYLLNKLAKIKPIAYLENGPKLKITSRFSDRVPFGTGPALTKISELENINEYLFYNPKCFELLKQWIEFLNNMWCDDQLIIDQPESNELTSLFHWLNCKIVFDKSKKQITSKDRWQQFVYQWFDAFKTLKTVHYFDRNLTRVNNKELLKSRVFAKVMNHSLQEFIDRND